MLAALDYMKNKRSAGPRNIPIELGKYRPKILWKRPFEIINKCLMEGHDVPDFGIWHTLVLCGKKDCVIYRGISVTGAVGIANGMVEF